MSPRPYISPLLALCFLVLSQIASADERILSFHSEVAVQSSGELFVTETIRVRAEGRNIKRGIYRDLLTIYKHPKYGHLGLNENAPIVMLRVTRNGRNEPWHKQSLDNGFRIYIGRKEAFIQRGEHEYQIEYLANVKRNANLTAPSSIGMSRAKAGLFLSIKPVHDLLTPITSRRPFTEPQPVTAAH